MGAQNFQVVSATNQVFGAGVTAQVSLPVDPALTTFITGFEVTAQPLGSGTPPSVTVSVLNTLGGDLLYVFTYPLYVGAQGFPGIIPLVIPFPISLPANAINTAIILQLPPPDGVSTILRSIIAHGYLA